MEQLVEYTNVKKFSRDLPLLKQLYRVRLSRDQARDLVRHLAKRDRIAIPKIMVASAAFYDYDHESILLAAKSPAEVVVHEYTHHWVWIRVYQRGDGLQVSEHGQEFVRRLDLSAKKAAEFLDLTFLSR